MIRRVAQTKVPQYFDGTEEFDKIDIQGVKSEIGVFSD